MAPQTGMGAGLGRCRGLDMAAESSGRPYDVRWDQLTSHSRSDSTKPLNDALVLASGLEQQAGPRK